MTGKVFDFLIIGSGFGGCLTALVLRRLGFEVVVVDRAKHPRFAIGESSTPIADSILRRLVTRFDLPELEPLTCYGLAKRELPSVTVGCKRGFSYFPHQRAERYHGSIDKANQLLVAASASDELSDTHWLRSEVDQHFAKLLVPHGIAFFEQTEITHIKRQQPWEVGVAGDRGTENLKAKFIVDASGRSGVLLNSMGIKPAVDPLLTRSQAVYGHFANVKPWRDLYSRSGGDVSQHPFRCDQAAVHHLLDSSWMWQLGFDNQITSAGFVFEIDDNNGYYQQTPDHIWSQTLAEYPSLQEQFSEATLIAPVAGIRKTGPLQFLSSEMAGSDWCVLPATGGFVDPLHSTGIGHTLSAIENLAGIFSRRSPGDQALSGQMRTYQQRLFDEFSLIDRLVYLCYRTLDNFEDFVAATMIYFAATVTYEQQRNALESDASNLSFLGADNPDFSRRVNEAIEFVTSKNGVGRSFQPFVKELIEPYNTVGLCDDSVSNMYQHTVAPGKL